MDLDLPRELASLERMTIGELRTRYAEVYGEATRSGHRTWLVRRIAWRMQARAEGDLTERARRRAAELADDAELRVLPPRMPTAMGAPVRSANRQVPMPGAVLTREYKGRLIQVTVLGKGFEYEGQKFRSLSAVTKAITGKHWNGYHFFGLRREAEA